MTTTTRISLILLGWVLCLLGTQPSWALPHPYFSKHPKQASQLESLLQQTRLKALEPQPADLSLQLSDLKGNDYALNQHRGDVLVLTRWATWCGACKAEMPFKIKLHQALKSKRFAFIGISDESRDTVNDYTQQAPVMYPISLLDPKGLMQKFFPGGAIPVTIIIDPWGWIVAMKTGGAQWDTTPYINLMRFLVSVAPSKKSFQTQEKAPAPKVAFAKTIKVKSGQAFSVDFALTWMGEKDKYSRILFRLPKEKGLQVLGVSTSGVAETGQGNKRKYTLRMKATKAGEFSLDPILLTYWLKDYDNHFQAPIGSMSVEVAGFLPKAKKAPSWALATLGAAALLLLLAIGLISRKKAKERDEALLPQQDHKHLEALKTSVKELLNAYQEAAYTEACTQARSLRKTYAESQDEELEELCEAAQYGGQSPTKEQTLRVMERLYLHLRDDYPDQLRPIKRLL